MATFVGDISKNSSLMLQIANRVASVLDPQGKIRNDGDNSAITYSKLSVILEFYPISVLNICIFISLLSRRRKIIQAGHIRHKDYPNSYKSKVVFLILWLTLVIIQAFLCFYSTIQHEKYWIE